MTDNISRMYELAGIDRKKPKCLDCFFENQSCLRSYDECPNLYPPFTDTKQLELIKYFSENIDFLELSHNGEEFEFYTNGSRTRDKDFSQALASFIYYKWDDLTDMQREEIRKALE